MSSVRAKALARGVTIGVIDGITGGLAGKAGGAVLKGGVGAASRVGRKGTALGVEMAGAAVGETAAQLVTDGHVDGFEVYAEAIGEFGAGSLNVFTPEVAAFAGYKAPEYKINGQAVSARQMIEHLNSGQLINNVEINNDSQMENRLSEVASDQAQPLEDVRTRVKRALFNRGYKATNDQIDDATADAFEDAQTALDAKDDSALNAAISRAVDRKIAKGRVSSVDVETEERSSRVSALSESSSDSRGSVAQELSDRAERSRKAAKEANTDEERAALNEAAETLEKKAREIRESRREFYRKASITNPDQVRRMRELDISIERLKAELSKEGLSAASKADLKSTLTELVRERIGIETAVQNEAKTPTQQQEDAAFIEDGGMAITNIDNEVAELSDMDQRMESKKDSDSYNKRKHDEVKNRLKDLKSRKERLTKLVSEYQEAKRAIESAESSGAAAVLEATEKATAIRNQIAEITGANQGVTSTEVSQRVESQVQARKTVQWFLDAVRSLPVSKVVRGEGNLLATSLESILSSDNFAMVTAENPFAQADGDLANSQANSRAEAWIKSRGLKFHRIAGRYEGNGENSFLVEGMTREQAAEFAKEFGQDSVAHKDGLVKADGSINLFDGNGATFFGEIGENPDYMSVVRDENGDLHAFSFMPSDQYQDADGNAITEDDFNQKERTKLSIHLI